MYTRMPISVYPVLGSASRICIRKSSDMGRLRLVGFLKLYVSFTKETYERDDILQKGPTVFEKITNRSHPIGKCGYICRDLNQVTGMRVYVCIPSSVYQAIGTATRICIRILQK